MRHSLYIQDLLEASKVAFLDVAKLDLERQGEKVNVSRLSVVTGIHRRDVMRIYKEENTVEQSQGLASRIIGQWQRDPRFTTKNRKPRVLSYEGENNEFQQLVKLVTHDVHPGTVMFELERINAVQKTARGLKLIVKAYVPQGNPEEGFHILAQDAEDLIGAVEENIFAGTEIPNLHGRTEFDSVRADAVPVIKDWLLEEGTSFHMKVSKYLSQFDLDLNPDPDYTLGRVKVSLGAFSRVTDKNSPGDG